MTFTREDIEELYELACIVGETFASIRCGEDDENTKQTRLELEKSYLPLARKIDALYAERQQNFFNYGQLS